VIDAANLILAAEKICPHNFYAMRAREPTTWLSAFCVQMQTQMRLNKGERALVAAPSTLEQDFRALSSSFLSIG
jgi:hypothetical protein